MHQKAFPLSLSQLRSHIARRLRNPLRKINAECVQIEMDIICFVWIASGWWLCKHICHNLMPFHNDKSCNQVNWIVCKLIVIPWSVLSFCLVSCRVVSCSESEPMCTQSNESVCAIVCLCFPWLLFVCVRNQAYIVSHFLNEGQKKHLC